MFFKVHNFIIFVDKACIVDDIHKNTSIVGGQQFLFKNDSEEENQNLINDQVELNN